jgi:hypothetical protein
MKLGHLLLNVVLVASGIFVYDLLRKDPPRAPSAAPEEAYGDVRETSVRDEQPLLLGAGFDAVVRRVEALEARVGASPVRSPEVRVVPGTSGEGDGGAGDPAALPDGPADQGPVRLPDVGDAKDPRIDPQTLAWLRAGMDEVDRIRDHERRVAQERARLGRVADLSLTEAQTEAVVALTLEHRTREQERGRALMQRDGGGVTRDDREALATELRGEYIRSLEKVVPASDAERIADVMVRPRFFPNRRGGERRAGDQVGADRNAR